MFNTGNNFDPQKWSLESGLKCDPLEKVTKDSFAEECDINTIVRRFGLTGELPVNVRAPMYGDFTEAMDYRSALDAVMAAQESFMALPADVRQRFGNDPASFVDFCSDPRNRDEAVKLGLVLPSAALPPDKEDKKEV